MRWLSYRVDTGNTERLRSIRTEICVVSLVVYTHADAEFGDQRIREKAIVIDADAVGVLDAGPSNSPVLVRGDAEDRGLEKRRTLVAQARAQAILISEVASTLASTNSYLCGRAAAQSSCSCPCGRWRRKEIQELVEMPSIKAEGMTFGQPSRVGARSINASTVVPLGPATVATPGVEVGDELLAAGAVGIAAEGL